jgi:hypothetical protein
MIKRTLASFPLHFRARFALFLDHASVTCTRTQSSSSHTFEVRLLTTRIVHVALPAYPSGPWIHSLFVQAASFFRQHPQAYSRKSSLSHLMKSEHL